MMVDLSAIAGAVPFLLKGLLFTFQVTVVGRAPLPWPPRTVTLRVLLRLRQIR